MSCRERRAIDVYVHAASQPVRRRKLAKVFTTIFHLYFLVVLAAKTLPVRLMLPFLTLVLRKRRNEVPENRRNSLHKSLLQNAGKFSPT